ncbi:hypothetical protein HanRHA438_Chr13g0600531 [Helianthus annuus]|nr:hypothetical protein HanRHA438_Chr13g0600531 [Helianthus annuus]
MVAAIITGSGGRPLVTVVEVVGIQLVIKQIKTKQLGMNRNMAKKMIITWYQVADRRNRTTEFGDSDGLPLGGTSLERNSDSQAKVMRFLKGIDGVFKRVILGWLV